MNHAHFVIIICYAQTSNLCNPLTLRHVTGSAYMIVYVHAEPYTYVCITVYRTTCTVIMLFHHSRSTSPTSSLTHVVDFDQGHPPTPTTALHLLPSPAVKHPKDMLTDTAVKHPKDMLTDTGTGLYVFDVHPASLVEHVVSSQLHDPHSIQVVSVVELQCNSPLIPAQQVGHDVEALFAYI